MEAFLKEHRSIFVDSINSSTSRNINLLACVIDFLLVFCAFFITPSKEGKGSIRCRNARRRSLTPQWREFEQIMSPQLTPCHPESRFCPQSEREASWWTADRLHVSPYHSAPPRLFNGSNCHATTDCPGQIPGRMGRLDACRIVIVMGNKMTMRLELGRYLTGVS